MRTSKDTFVNGKPSSKIKPRTSSEMKFLVENVPKSSVTTMSTISKNPQFEEDEFWKDCIEENTINSNKETDIGKTKESTKQIDDDYLTFNEEKNDHNIKPNHFITKHESNTINVDIQHKFKSLLNKLGYESNELNLKHNTISHQQKESIERCHLLYEKGKIKNEVNKLIFLKNNEIKEKAELSECTFKPRTNSAKRLYTKKDFNQLEKEKIYERGKNWKKKTNDKLDREKNIINKNNNDCTFKPQLNTNDVSLIFNNKNSIINDFNNRNFMMRLQNARNEEKEKKQRLLQSTKNDKLKKTVMRSTSAENTIYFEKNMQKSIRNLHQELHALTLDTIN